MNKLIKELNIVFVSEHRINVDRIGKQEVKDRLNQGFEVSPRYIEIPEVAIFDYTNNVEFPIQMNIQGPRVVFVTNGSPAQVNLDDNPEFYRYFVEQFVSLISLSEFSSELGSPLAVGFNISFATTSETGETTFSSAVSRLNSIFQDKGSPVTNGFDITRNSGDNIRYRFILKPVVPEVGSDFTDSYNISINKHWQPINEANWKILLTDKFTDFINEAKQMIDDLNGLSDE